MKLFLRKRAIFKVIGTCLFFIFCIYFITNVIFGKAGTSNYDFSYLDIPNENLPPVGITKMEDFPKSGTYKIPKIIHQTWKTSDIPSIFVPWVKSWARNNPDWEYWFWTDENTRQFISEKYPDFLPVFDAYPQPIRRADAMRYFILYEFGGVYADLDLESLQSLNPIIKKYHCFLAQEPFVHSVLDSNFENLVINALMGCRKGHPFMKLLMDNLPMFANMWHVLDSTGPHFVTLWYREYKNYHLPDVHINGTYLAPSEYFFPTIDPLKLSPFHSKCKEYHSLSTMQRRACFHLKKTSSPEINLKFSFTIHHWVHTYNYLTHLDFKYPVDIHELIPNVQLYGPSVG